MPPSSPRRAVARALLGGASLLALGLLDRAAAQPAPQELPAISVTAPAAKPRKAPRPVLTARPKAAAPRPAVVAGPRPRPAAVQAIRAAPVARIRRVAVARNVARPAAPAIPSAAAAPSAAVASASASYTPPVLRDPPGQTVTTIPADIVRNTPVFTVGDLLQYSPGVSIKQGNGPRDVGISIRGSNARNGFGVRNIVVLEDGFPVTQPDGLSRTDLIDPHAYGAVDVYRGPSSALFGNYATGGAVNFRLRTGAQIDGAELGTDFGSFGFLSNYLIAGKKVGALDVSLFASNVRGDGFISHSDFNTQTVNAIARYSPTEADRFTLKVIHNELYGNLPIRQSFEQFLLNPFQRGCTIASITSQGYCPRVNVAANGIAGATIPQSAEQAGLHRNDRRDVVGLRWEHDFDPHTTWRTQFTYDDRNINQPTGATTAIGDYPSINVISDVTRRGDFLGFDATHFLQFNFNRLRNTATTNNVLPFSEGAAGALANKTDQMQSNIGGRAREEIRFDPHWTGVLGLGGEVTHIRALNAGLAYNARGVPTGFAAGGPVFVDRSYANLAPEAALRFRPNAEWQVRGRVAGGYGTPNAGQLFVTQAGLPGPNVALKSQTNLGVDLGVDWTPLPGAIVSVTGFYEWFRNEQLTQTPGAGLLAYTFNAPASIHRGLEVAADWRFWDGFRALAAYTFNDQRFESFTEQLGAGAFFDRRGYRIPGVAPHEITARLGYDVPVGELRGLGGFVEYVGKSAYVVDNGNGLKIPSFGLVNANVHYDRAVEFGFIRSIAAYIELRNAFNRTYVASANNIVNTLTNGVQNPGFYLAQFSTGSIYAGSPRALQAGVKIKF